MTIEFNPSRGATLGVEWELQLVDTHTRHLRQDARDVLAAVPDLSEGQRPKAMHELMQSQVEIITDVCHTVAEAVQDLRKSIGRLAEAVEPRGIALACTGTHAISDWRDAVYAPNQRYVELVEEMQWLAWRIQTFGVHVHVGVRDRDKVIPIVNALAAYLPHFLALTSSSPYWGGQDTGLASSRAIVFGSLPTAGPPHLLADWAEFEEYMDTLIKAGTIRSIKEVWWDIRPHPDFGTIEIRMFDGIPTPREVGMVAALSQCLVQQFDQQIDRGYTLPHPAAWVVRDNKWRATRYGLDADVITDDHGSTAPMRDVLYELQRELEPVAERLGCAEELAVVTDVLEQGSSSERQRAILADGGSLQDVVDATIIELAEDRFVTSNPNRDAGHSGS
ncbi:glutamate--cysteine ligase [Microbispora triticiradicis]|uniref:Putative glutamate--cysteine ligase 2 n=3 Tax=Microbispora TaxID=2005 RepID=A0ABY3M422_9ACTN|nr:MULTISPECIES: glutamate--cysteine ligase [Microbispora]RGA05928.1 glutamate--cysteine ligase [Microbispora triticiradicis]TLP62215.1 glutamate--cysteine ligase [Microbispora fusca]TYB66323.1 glutamate--cysteine ligase [Microbispora tritici]GLW21974.1 putative glutamate--cysteine ligase 2 [Microbispora amethystogenes]